MRETPIVTRASEANFAADFAVAVFTRAAMKCIIISEWLVEQEDRGYHPNVR